MGKALEPTTKTPAEVKKVTEDPYEGLNVKISEWKPEMIPSESTTSNSEPSSTVKSTTSRSRSKSAINLFRKSNLFKNLRTYTAESTTVTESPTTSSSFKFGERTSKKTIDNSTPTNIKQMKSRQKTKTYLPTPDTISERNYERQWDETTANDSSDSEDETTVGEIENTTTPFRL